MSDQKDFALESLESIQNIVGFLKSDMSLGEPSEGKIKAEIKVQNTAPRSSDGSEVVFLGVGLTIIDGRERGRPNLASQVNLSRPSDHVEERHKYNKGEWGGKHGEERFPAYTADEQSHGEILFPGESLVYEFNSSERDLPYLEIRVEGSVSRRHLFHISRPMAVMKKWTEPLIIETFQAVEKLDYYKPLLSVIDKIPKFGPQTTLADIDVFRSALANAEVHIDAIMKELNKVYHSAPNQELRDFMKQYIGNYLTNSRKLCSSVLKTLSGNDTKQMREATEEMKAYLLTVEKVKHQQAELMSQFEVDKNI